MSDTRSDEHAPTTEGWTFADIWEVVADCLPDAPALMHGPDTVSWRQFERRADAMARFLLDRGCSHQGKVAFYLHNRPEYSELFFACSKASLVHVNTNYRYADAELTYIWDNADTEAVVFGATFTETTDRYKLSFTAPGSGDCNAGHTLEAFCHVDVREFAQFFRRNGINNRVRIPLRVHATLQGAPNTCNCYNILICTLSMCTGNRQQCE